MPYRIARIVPLALIAGTAAVMPLRAAESGRLDLSGQVFEEVVTTDGNGGQRRALVPASSLTRGDRLIFVVRYRNLGSAPVRDYAVSAPFPARVRFEDNPRQPVEVSVDGGKNWGQLNRLYSINANGTPQPISPERVTHVRLRVAGPVMPGDGGQFSYRGIVR